MQGLQLEQSPSRSSSKGELPVHSFMSLMTYGATDAEHDNVSSRCFIPYSCDRVIFYYMEIL